MPITDHDALAAALADHAPFAAVYGDLDPQTLPVAGLMHAAVAAKRLVAHAQAFQARVFAAAERVIQAQDAGSSRGRGAVESQVGATLHLPPATLRGLLGECGALCERFPEAFALLRRGGGVLVPGQAAAGSDLLHERGARARGAGAGVGDDAGAVRAHHL